MAGLRRIVGHLHKPCNAAVDERAIAKNADDAAGLFFRQRVTQSKPDTDACAHTNNGVYRLERRQYTERIAPDVPRHNAVEFL